MSRKAQPSRLPWFLAFFAISLFVFGEAVLFARSEAGLLFLARNGVVLSQTEVSESLSRTVRGSLRRLGVPRGAHKVTEIEKDDGPRIRWEVALGPRASLIQVNAALSEAIEERGGRVFDGWESSDRESGTRVTLDLGIGRIHTHEIVLVRRADPDAPDIVRVALILEGFGREESDSLATVALTEGFEFSGAVLTNGDDPRGWSEALAKSDREVVAYVPMEPMNYPSRSPGSDAILVDQSTGKVRGLVRRHLGKARRPVAFYPYMGGMALRDHQVMEVVMLELEKQEVAYIEPPDRQGSIALDVASTSGVRFVRIDEVLNPSSVRGSRRSKAIRSRLEEVANTARRRGFATCVGRLDPVLLDVLSKEIPRLEKQGVRFVPFSALLRPSAL